MTRSTLAEVRLSTSQRTLQCAERVLFYRDHPEQVPAEMRGKVLRTVREAAGCAITSVLHAQIILQHGTPEEVAAVRAGRASVSAMYQRVKARQDARPDNAARVAALVARPVPVAEPVVIQFPPRARTGARIRVPAGMSLLELARQAVELRKTKPSVEAVAKALGISGQVCRQMIDIVLVAERRDLSRADAALAAAARRGLQEGTTKVSDLYAAIQPLCLRLWGPQGGSNRDRDGREAARRMRFDAGLGVVLQSCANTAQVALPHLSPKELAGVRRELRLARAYLLDLSKRLGGDEL